MAVYSASKFAGGDQQRASLRVAAVGIRVVLIEPGNFKTRAGTNMYYPKSVRNGAKEGTSDPLYARIMSIV